MVTLSTVASPIYRNRYQCPSRSGKSWSGSEDSKGKQGRRPWSTVTFLRRCGRAIGQENAFPWIERDIGIDFDKWEMPTVDKVTMQATRPACSSAADAAWGPREHHLGRGLTATRAAISIHNHCHGVPLTERLPIG